MRSALGALLLLACACSARSTLEVPGTHDAGAAGGMPVPDGGFPSCAFTAEPAPPGPPPCSEYVGVDGDLAACGISTTPGPLPAAVCAVECVTTTECALLADAGGFGFGPTVIGCGCQ
jgi:hypothetical protein